MSEPEEEARKKLGIDVARAIVSGVLAASSSLDTFATWLLGATTGFLVLLVTNIEGTLRILQPVSVKLMIVVLTLSVILGLFQKLIALYFHVQTVIETEARRKVSETVNIHSGETLVNPYSYVREHADGSHLLFSFVTAFPDWLQKIFQERILSEPKNDLSHLQKDTKKLVWQSILLLGQVLLTLVSVGIVLCSL